MRILAIDFGEKRIGLATSDATGTLATPRRTLLRKDDAGAAAEILEFCRQEEIDLVLVGLPKFPDGTESPFAGRIRSFAARLSGGGSIPVRLHEETLTSNEAARRVRPGSAREELDRMAAAVLLEDYLHHRSRPPGNGGEP